MVGDIEGWCTRCSTLRYRRLKKVHAAPAYITSFSLAVLLVTVVARLHSVTVCSMTDVSVVGVSRNLLETLGVLGGVHKHLSSATSVYIHIHVPLTQATVRSNIDHLPSHTVSEILYSRRWNYAQKVACF